MRGCARSRGRKGRREAGRGAARQTFRGAAAARQLLRGGPVQELAMPTGSSACAPKGLSRTSVPRSAAIGTDESISIPTAFAVDAPGSGRRAAPRRHSRHPAQGSPQKRGEIRKLRVFAGTAGVMRQTYLHRSAAIARVHQRALPVGDSSDGPVRPWLFQSTPTATLRRTSPLRKRRPRAGSARTAPTPAR